MLALGIQIIASIAGTALVVLTLAFVVARGLDAVVWAFTPKSQKGSEEDEH